MTKGRVALWLLVPALIVAGSYARGWRLGAARAGGEEARLRVAAGFLDRELQSRVLAATRYALALRDHGLEAADPLPKALSDRLEGAGVLRAGAFERWTGTPAEPQEFGPEPGVRLSRRGIRTSLLVRTPADADGRAGAASFVLEIRSGAVGAARWLPTGSPAITAQLDDAAPPASPGYDAGPPARLVWEWRDREGHRVAAIVLEDRPAASAAARARAIGWAWSALALALLAPLVWARRAGAGDGRRALALIALILVVRAALAAGRTLEELLPREVATASLYGRGGALGWLASPAALAATAWAFYLVAMIVARWAARHRDDPGFRRAAVAAIAAAGVVAAIALGGSLARDARIPVPRLALAVPGSLLLAIALALVLAGTAEAAATALLLSRRSGTSRTAVAVALVPVTLIALANLHRTEVRMIEDRLRVEFAPLVRDQSARRRVALTASVGEAAANPDVARALARYPEDDDPFLAYGLWTSSALFHQGFASSLNLYDAAGVRRGHFEFAFPQVGGAGEAAPRAANGPVTVAKETIPIGSSSLVVLHAEATVRDAEGAILGRVVGHVLEDPSNLPFLPGSAPYLQALGHGAVSPDDAARDAPDYVLFDETGHVDLTTVHQPPAPDAALRAAAAASRVVGVGAGDTRFLALPIEDGRRLHLLMAPAPTWLDATADVVRMLLLGVAVLAIAALWRIVVTPGGLESLPDLVRGSLRRKLLAAGLAASIIPLVAMALLLRASIERRSEASLADTAATVVGAAQRVVEDYQSVGDDDQAAPPLRLNDEALSWLRRVVGQEIHLFEGGEVAATSKPELFDSGLVRTRLAGEVDRAIVHAGQPFVLRNEKLGEIPLPVAYAPVDVRGGPTDAVIAVPLVVESRAASRSVERLVEMLLLLTTALVGLLAGTSALLARSVARPIRRIADASRRIAEGDYDARLASSSRDELGALVGDFNRMARSLADQRADLTRRRDYIEALLRHATTGVISTDASGIVVTINPAAETLLGGAGRAPRRGAALDDELAPALRAALAAQGFAPDPVEVDLPAGDRPVRLRVVRVPLPDPAGGDTGSLVLLDDVTSQVRMHQLAAWAEMARAIAHEIKNPLTPIQLSAEHVRRLLADRGVLPEAEIEACLETITRQVRELREISTAFSAYAKIPDLALERLEPDAFLRDVAAPYRVAPPPGVRVEEDLTPAHEILADRRSLARAVVNLIENALQAMQHGGTLRVRTRDLGADRVALEVEDDGPGLAPEVRRHLFEPYFSTKSAGTGLGLAIARRVVEAHGGTIEAASAEGRGTVFRIVLPVAPPV
ncbi:MAG TPA: ATP-binding protein [Candidatus Polarisedimenticolaceae bacterium]|nr:ATP-binding protein [Candidatus Polarisedimenticolaceae bacterium]